MIHVTLMWLLPGVEETARNRHSQKPAEDRCLILVHRSPWFSNWHFIFTNSFSFYVLQKLSENRKDRFEVYLYTPRLFSPKLKPSPPQPNPARGPLLFLSNSFGLLQYFPWESYNCNVIHGEFYIFSVDIHDFFEVTTSWSHHQDHAQA